MDWIDRERANRAAGINRPLLQSEHAAVNQRHPGTTLEYCCECGEPTGRAGRGEDSIYVEESIYADDISDGNEIGPLCGECYIDMVDEGIIEE